MALNIRVAIFSAIIMLFGSERTICLRDLSSLKSVQIIFRHGERQLNDNLQSSGDKELTDAGKKEIYQLGRFLRERYGGFLKPGFDANEATFISSDVDRTIRSAYLLAYGLYEGSNTKSSWARPGVKYEYDGIPIRSIPTEMDRYIQSTQSCPRYDDELFVDSFARCYEKSIYTGADVIEEYSKAIGNREWYNPGQNMFQILWTPAAFMEGVAANISNNFPLNDAGRHMSQFPEFLQLKLICLEESLSTPERQKLYSGPLLGMILESFSRKDTNKFTAYAGHDRTLIGQLAVLGNPPSENPPTGAALIIELHDTNIQSEQVLKFFYRSNATSPPALLSITTCGEPCYLETFIQLKKDLLPVEFEKECRVLKPSANQTQKF